MGNDKVLSMVGLARRAGAVGVGAFLAEKHIQNGKAEMIIVAVDSADNVKKKFTNSCKYYEVDYYEYGTKDTLGQCTGKENIAVVSIDDYNFAKGIKDKMNAAVPKQQ